MADQFEAYSRAVDARFSAAIERLSLLVAMARELQVFEEAARKTARSRIDASKASSLKQEMERFDALAAALKEGLDRHVEAASKLARLPAELDPGKYIRAILTILNQPERQPEIAVELYLQHRAMDARWIVPVMKEGSARAVFSLDDFMTRRIELHCELFDVPVPGSLQSIFTKVAAEFRRDPIELLMPMELPGVVKRALKLISRCQAPESGFSKGAMDEMNRIFGYMDAAQPLLDAENAAVLDIAEAEKIQTEMTDDLAELARDILVAYTNP